MPTPAQAHFLRVSAVVASAAAAADNPLQNATGYELMLAKLAEDRRRLKGIQSMEAKADVKREILPEYAPWVDGVLTSGSGAQDEVLMSVMVWRIDAGDYAGAMDIAAYAIAHKLLMPDRYQRTTGTVIAEEIADAAKRAREGNVLFDPDIILRAMTLTEFTDMPDQVRAKLHKEFGLALFDIDKSVALGHLQRATQLHDKVGVKKEMEKLERELKNLGAATGSV